MSDYRRRMVAITDELYAQGVGRYTSAPPVFRLAWRLGYDVKPPPRPDVRLGSSRGVLPVTLSWGI